MGFRIQEGYPEYDTWPNGKQIKDILVYIQRVYKKGNKH